MADTYVCSGAMMRCTFGTSTARLRVLPDRTVWVAGQRMANIMDHKSMANIPGFGRCRTVTYPATGAATAAAHGKLTPMPCIPGTLTPWMPGKTDYLIQGPPALLKSCKCMCQWGGVITITDDGQHTEGTQWVNKENAENFQRNETETEEADNVQTSKKALTEQKKEYIGKSKIKIKPSTAEIVLPNFNRYHPSVQQRIISMAEEMPDNLNLQEKLKIAENNLRIEKALNIKKGKRMTIEDADNQNANPEYKPNTQFGRNCATAAPTYVLRLQGFDVKAKGKFETEHNTWLSKGNSFKIWKNVHGTEAKPTLVNDWMKKKKTPDGKPITAMTPILYKEYLEETCKQEGVYVLTLQWKPDDNGKTTSHATIIQRWKDEDGKMHLSQIEPQVYNEKAGTKRSIDNLCKRLNPTPPSDKGIMRVDNKLFDTTYADIFKT